jgi:hypothetical protein
MIWRIIRNTNTLSGKNAEFLSVTAGGRVDTVAMVL